MPSNAVKIENFDSEEHDRRQRILDLTLRHYELLVEEYRLGLLPQHPLLDRGFERLESELKAIGTTGTLSDESRFFAGGLLKVHGIFDQERVMDFIPGTKGKISPAEALEWCLRGNMVKSYLRKTLDFPRPHLAAKAVRIGCIDPRVRNAGIFVGDARPLWDDLAMPGTPIPPAIQEGVEGAAMIHDLTLIWVVIHLECGGRSLAERPWDPNYHKVPLVVDGIHDFPRGLRELLLKPTIRERLRDQKTWVVVALENPNTRELIEVRKVSLSPEYELQFACCSLREDFSLEIGETTKEEPHWFAVHETTREKWELNQRKSKDDL